MSSYADVVRARLVTEGGARDPDASAQVEQKLTFGVPQRIRLDNDLELALIVPTGLAVEWRDRDAGAVVSQSAAERAPHRPDPSASIGALDRPPARLVLLDHGDVAGVVPLVAARACRVPGNGAHPVRAEITVTEWDLRSGALRGPGDAISTVVLTWRRVDRAVDHFATVPVPRRVTSRLAPQNRMESELGLSRPVRDAQQWSKAKVKVEQ
jgi:hypothetical protein